MTSSAQFLQAGKFLIDNAYEVLAPIGRGKASVVYKARCLPGAPVQSLGQSNVAIKVFLGGQRLSLKERAIREAHAALACRHENVVRMIDFVAGEELCFIVMELVENGDLRTLLSQRTEPFEWDQALAIVEQVCRGLARIHRAGIVHRDIKPENLLIAEDGSVKIADFGVASMPSDGSPDEEAGKGVGTLEYLAPETLKLGFCDARSDIYAVGVTLYQLLTQNFPFKGESFAGEVTAKLEGKKQPLAQYLREVPLHLDALLDKALAPNPRERFASAEEFAEAIAQFRRGEWRPMAQAEPGADNVVSFKRAKARARIDTPRMAFSPQVTVCDVTENALLASKQIAQGDLGELLLEEAQERAPANSDEQQVVPPRLGILAQVALFFLVVLLVGAVFIWLKNPRHWFSALPETTESRGLLQDELQGKVFSLLGDDGDAVIAATPGQSDALLFRLAVSGAEPVLVRQSDFAKDRGIVLDFQGLQLELQIQQSKNSPANVLLGTYTERGTNKRGVWYLRGVKSSVSAGQG